MPQKIETLGFFFFKHAIELGINKVEILLVLA